MRSTLLSLAVALSLSACSMTPEFVRPDPPIARTYPGQTEVPNEPAVAELGWHAMFGDPRLQVLIEASLSHNRDLRIAMLNVESSLSDYAIQRAGRLPAVAATGGVTRARALTQLPEPTVQRQINVGVGVSAFELDLWGRARATSEAAYARYLASDEGRRAAKISLIAAVADAFFAERLAVEQEDLARRTLASWTEQRDLALQLRKAMQGSGIDVAQAEGQVARARAELEARRRDVQRTRNALTQLVAADLDTLDLPEPTALERQPVRSQLPPGLPSELLTHRPDIRQAEQALRAANADIGAARAAFFPQISLTTSLGFASADMASLFRGSSRVWTFAPSVTQPLFDAGRLRAELRLSELRQSVAVAEYERVIQLAFREVADGLAGTATYAQQIEAQERVVKEERQRESLASQRHRAGVDSRLEWLDAQRALFAAQLELLTLRRDALGNVAGLYKALGGGAFRDGRRGF